VNVAVVLPETTVTEAGTVKAAALLNRLTVAPAALDTVAVQVALPPDPRLVGLHANPVTTTGAAREIVAVRVLPFNDAVRVAVWLLAMVPAVAVNVAVELPEATVTKAGMVNAAALLDKETAIPPVGAVVLKETVHADEPPVVSDAGTQLSPLTRGAAVIPPPTPVIGSEFASAVAPRAFVTAIAALVALDAIVTPSTATTPFCITAPFRPANTQV
jgi:hypothetical protein